MGCCKGPFTCQEIMAVALLSFNHVLRFEFTGEMKV